MQYLIGLFLGIGLYLILADYFRVPYFATSKAHNNLAHRQEQKTSSLTSGSGISPCGCRIISN